MQLITLAAKNMLRRPMRTALTVAGVAIAIGATVALVSLSRGFEQAFLDQYEQRGVDAVVVRSGVTERITSTLDAGLEAKLAALPQVAEVAPELMDVISFEDLNLIGVMAFGWRPGSLPFRSLTMLKGRTLRADDHRAVIVGTILASDLDKKVGDEVSLYGGEPYQVVGIFKTANMSQNASLIAPLEELQRLTDLGRQVTLFDVVLRDRGSREAVDRFLADVPREMPGCSAMTTESYVSTSSQIRIGRAAVWVTSAIALLIGTVGVLNTMVMAIYERTMEIGILRAIGWRPSRVLRLLLAESMLLSGLGAAAGVALAIGVSFALAHLRQAAGLMDGRIPPAIALQGLGYALLMGLLGGFLPALRGARMDPIKALHHD